MNGSPWRAFALRVVLWVGLLLCVAAVWQGARVTHIQWRSMSFGNWILFTGGLVAALVMGVGGWRETLHAFTGVRIPWSAAVRQTGLLLVGKYLPGGVFGFVARMMDDQRMPRGQRVGAGLVEQAVSLMAVVLVGAVLFTAAKTSMPMIALMLLLLPAVLYALALAALALWRHAEQRYPRLGVMAGVVLHPASLRRASIIATFQALTWATLAALMAHWLFDLGFVPSMGIGGAFGLAVGAGMVALFAPGGIGIREGALVILCAPFMGAAPSLVLAAILRLASAMLDIVAGTAAALIGRTGSVSIPDDPRPQGDDV